MEQNSDIKALEQAFAMFTQTTQSMEESYRRLEQRLRDLDRELAEKNHELALTSDYLKSILESMSDGVIAVDIDGVITTFNHAATRVLGYPAEEVVGTPFRELFNRDFSVPPEEPEAMQLRTQNGGAVSVGERDSPVAGPDDSQLGLVKVFQDLSEIEALREHVRRIDRLAALGEMAATVAHEIRNPLGGIRGFAALLARDMDDGDPGKRLVDKILVGTSDLDKVVSGLLEYTRPVDLHLRLTTVADLVEAALGYLELDGRSITIKTDIASGLSVMSDPDKMRQVFLNVLLNAVQSIDATGCITITAHEDDQQVAVAVSDTGSGMTPEQLEHIFYPFYTTREKGTGLGLAVAWKIMAGHHGHIEASSQPGLGSTFTITLPRKT